MRVRISRNRAVVLAAGLAALCGLAAAPALPPGTTPRNAADMTIPRDPLDAAFRFATAIEADPNDQAMAQERVVSELIALGRVDEAGERAARIQGWRKGTSFADVARAHAGRGDTARSRAFLAQADEVRRSTADWGGPRIAAHMAQALAVLGDVDQATALAQEIAAADPRQYSGRAAASIADGLARRGDFAAAMERLRTLDGERDYEIAWWRTAGYLDLARRPGAAGETAEALRAARRSAEGIAGWKRGEVLLDIGREYLGSSERRKAGEALSAAAEVIEPLPQSLPVRTALMSDLAAAWGLFGDKARARLLLERAEREAPAAARIDRPGAWGAIAGTLWSLGDHDAARGLFERALSDAEALVNARPRALAVVDICRSLGRHRVDVGPGTQARLDTLFAGLRDPW